MSQTIGCERFEAQRARKARVPQSAEKLTIRNQTGRTGLAVAGWDILYVPFCNLLGESVS